MFHNQRDQELHRKTFNSFFEKVPFRAYGGT